MFHRKPWLKEQFFNLITSTTGLNIREQDQDAICRKLYYRIKSLHFSRPEDYYQLLISRTLQSQQEWRELILELTTTESYFFRDKGLFKLLKTGILPQLIEKKKKSFAASHSLAPHHQNLNGIHYKPTLRIWSAGCSTGEEPYSLAICLQQLIPDWDNWNVLILATDINEFALEKAKQGNYNYWSFRSVDEDVKTQYFQNQKSTLAINPNIKKCVHFMYNNLVQDSFPVPFNPNFSGNSVSIEQMDLIICRNVFVYFEHRFIALVLHKFFQTLNPGGYLITGHAELHGQDLTGFQPHIFPESIIYEKRDNSSAPIHTPPSSWPQIPEISQNQTFSSSHLNNSSNQPIYFQDKQHPALIENSIVPQQIKIPTLKAQIVNTQTIQTSQLLSEAQILFQQKNYPQAIRQAKQVIQQEPQQFHAYYLLGQIHANLGQYQEASYYCEQALNIDSTSIPVYYLLIQIAEETGDIAKAKILLKRIIYFCPSSIVAYLHLGAIYENENDILRAKKMYQTAFNLIKNLPENSIPEPHNHLTVAELTLYLTQILKKYSQA